MKYLLLFSLFFNIFSCATSPENPKNIVISGDYHSAYYAIDEIFSMELKNNNIKGGALSITEGKNLIYSTVKGEGFQEKLNKDSLFRIASISKLFTAIAIIKLFEQGKLKLDDPIDKYFPNFTYKNKKPSDKITIQMLLTHQSGLPPILKDFYLNKDIKPDNIFDSIKEEALIYNPGERFHYSNTAYHVLGALIEKVSGKSYTKFIQTEILLPLNMFSTYVDSETAIDSGGFEKSIVGFDKVDYYSIRDKPAGSFLSTLEDMEKFAIFLATKNANLGILKKESFDMMYKKITPSDKLSAYRPYGLGFMSNYLEIPNFSEIGHAGDLPGYTVYLSVIPDKQLGGVVLLNSGTGRISRLNILRDSMISALQLKHNEIGLGSKIESIPKRNIEEIFNNDYSGTYNFEMGGLEIKKVGNTYDATLNGNNIVLEKINDYRYKLGVKAFGLISIDLAKASGLDNMEFEFIRTEKETNHVFLNLNRKGIDMKLIADGVPSYIYDREYDSFVGSYIMARKSIQHTTPYNTIKSIVIKKNKDRLYIDLDRGFLHKIRYYPYPVSNDRLRVLGVGDFTLEKGSLRYSGFYFEKENTNYK
jgi:CubicO group peptidase (beta-lactamase class C family)